MAEACFLLAVAGLVILKIYLRYDRKPKRKVFVDLEVDGGPNTIAVDGKLVNLAQPDAEEMRRLLVPRWDDNLV